MLRALSSVKSASNAPLHGPIDPNQILMRPLIIMRDDPPAISRGSRDSDPKARRRMVRHGVARCGRRAGGPVVPLTAAAAAAACDSVRHRWWYRYIFIHIKSIYILPSPVPAGRTKQTLPTPGQGRQPAPALPQRGGRDPSQIYDLDIVCMVASGHQIDR